MGATISPTTIPVSPTPGGIIAPVRKKTSGKRENGSGSIYKDGNGYRVQLLVENDGRHFAIKRRAKSQDEAVSILKKLTAENFLGRLAPANQQTVESFLTAWVETTVKKNSSPNTYRQYAWLIKTHIAPVIGTRKLDQLNRSHIKNLLAAKANQKVSSRAKTKVETERVISHSTLRLIRAILHAALNHAVHDLGLLGFNPADKIALPKAPQKTPDFLRPEDAEKLFKHSFASPIGSLIRFFLGTGVRIGEATGVRWQDVSLDLKQVCICGQLQRHDKKLTYQPSTKTNQVRFLTLPDFVLKDLKRLKAAQTADEISDPDGLVFLTPTGGRLDPKYVRDHLAACCSKAEVKVISPHKLRHTAATFALAKTGDLHAVQKWLGHQQSSLTANLYGHATQQAMKRVADALGEGLAPKPVRRKSPAKAPVGKP